MIYSFLKPIVRHLYQKPVYQFLNVATLTVGLTVAGVVFLFALHERQSKPFLLLSILSLVLGTSLSTYLVHQWLQSFAYKARGSWWLSMIPFMVLLGVLMVTVGWHSYNAARVNPVKSLRSE